MPPGFAAALAFGACVGVGAAVFAAATLVGLSREFLDAIFSSRAGFTSAAGILVGAGGG
jgi:hypothetical protein